MRTNVRLNAVIGDDSGLWAFGRPQIVSRVLSAPPIIILLVWGLRVHSTGLEAWSAQCMTAAEELAACPSVTTDLPSGQATSAAVAASQTITTTAAKALAARVRATGAKASIAATSYSESDEQSAQLLAAVAERSVVV